MKLISLLFFIILNSFATLWGQTIKVEQYLPLKEGNQYQFVGEFDGTQYWNQLVCKVHKTSDGEQVFYLVNLNQAEGMIGPNLFGLGAFVWRNGSLFTLEADFERELLEKKEINPQMIIPRKLKLKQENSFHIYAGNAIKTINFPALEDIEIKAGVYKNCLKVHIHTVWSSGSVYDEYIWLAKGVGVVKWRRATERVDELVKVQLN